MKRELTTTPLPFFFVGKDVVSERISNYSTKHDLLSTEIEKPDTRSVWYSKDHIIKLLEEIDLVEGDGLRVFLGSYESTHAEYADQTCLLMVVTREQETENGTIHANVVLEDEPGFGDRSALPRDIPSWIDNNKKRDFNHGSPCPPVCDSLQGVDFP
jgi:hypothetical protein